MQKNEIRARGVKRFTATTDAKHALPVAENTLDRQWDTCARRHSGNSQGFQIHGSLTWQLNLVSALSGETQVLVEQHPDHPADTNLC